jgi:very-short-patch-repair endonuclease
MANTEAKRHVHPVILARAKELRLPLTPQENKLWQRLRAKQLYGLKFRRQHPLDRFILDFFCVGRRLVIEIDGSGHANPDQQAYDQARTEWLEQRGLRVIRFTNLEVDTTLTGVLAAIAEACGCFKEMEIEQGYHEVSD